MHRSRSAPLILTIAALALAPAACGAPPVEGETGATSGLTDSTTEVSAGTLGESTSEGSSGGGSSGSSSGSSTASTTGSTTSGTTDASTTGMPTTTRDPSGDPSGDPTGGTEPTSTTGVEPTTTGTSTDTDTDTDTDGTTGGTTDGTTGDTEGEGGLWNTPNLWYSVDDALVYIEIDPLDGSVVGLVHNTLVPTQPLHHGQNGLTMLENGGLLGSREAASGTQIYYVADPPITPDTEAVAKVLGVVPTDGNAPLRIEALYTDCDGRVYLMDTGKDVSNSDGNRLLRFTGNYLAGDLAFEVITDLENASVGDIDDMSPGIVEGEISDSLGFAMDSSVLWQLDYTTGTGMLLAQTDGTWGIHALGGPLFKDLTPRLYILSAGDANTGAELREVYLGDYSNSQPLIEGPDLNLNTGYNGWSGLAGPLTECMTTIPQ